MSLTDLDAFAGVTTPLEPAPKGWEPYVETTGDAGRAVVRHPRPGAKEQELLLEAGFDPEDYRIVGKISYSKRQNSNLEWQHYYKFDFARITDETPEEVRADIEDIVRSILKKTPKIPTLVSNDAVVAVLSDWQIGKRTKHSVEAIKRAVENFKRHVRNLRKAGRVLDTLVLLLTGDLHEGCDGHYSMQTFEVDLDRRGQNKVVRRMIAWIIRELRSLFTFIKVVAVGGNHGENRRNGKAFTSFSDNDDVAVVEQVQEIFEGRDGYEGVEFFIADDELMACVDIKGVPVGITHGHLASRGGALPQAKQKQWWGDQWWDENSPIPKSKILVTSHYHHFTAGNYGTRTHFQSPAFDGGSKWFGDMSGMNSPDGMLTFVVDPAHPLGWDDCKIL